ncbi:hypothetical protein L0337_11355 [candidate division KSB1 bacterium]|nr:hypothetical protein [candidate division KSB1 bacterium]
MDREVTQSARLEISGRLMLNDNHLHIIAAPGSGKTILGLEVVRRLNKPALILSPTLAVRDTRTVEGRKLMLKAHESSLSSNFQLRSERVSCWK